VVVALQGDGRKMKLELVQNFDGASTFLVFRGKNHNTVVN
jgi:hypothetical protein